MHRQYCHDPGLDQFGGQALEARPEIDNLHLAEMQDHEPRKLISIPTVREKVDHYLRCNPLGRACGSRQFDFRAYVTGLVYSGMSVSYYMHYMRVLAELV